MPLDRYVRDGTFISAQQGRRSEHRSHNPLGALSTVALLSLMAGQALAGAFANDDIAFYGPLSLILLLLVWRLLFRRRTHVIVAERDTRA